MYNLGLILSKKNCTLCIKNLQLDKQILFKKYIIKLMIEMQKGFMITKKIINNYNEVTQYFFLSTKPSIIGLHITDINIIFTTFLSYFSQ